MPGWSVEDPAMGSKHGPVLGEYVAGHVLGNSTATPEPRFSLATKHISVQNREVH